MNDSVAFDNDDLNETDDWQRMVCDQCLSVYKHRCRRWLTSNDRIGKWCETKKRILRRINSYLRWHRNERKKEHRVWLTLKWWLILGEFLLHLFEEHKTHICSKDRIYLPKSIVQRWLSTHESHLRTYRMTDTGRGKKRWFLSLSLLIFKWHILSRSSQISQVCLWQSQSRAIRSLNFVVD